MNQLVFNSIAVERRNPYKVIDLFAECGGLSETLERMWKHATIRVTKDSCESLWEDNPCLSQQSEVFFVDWEEELHDIPRGEHYSVKADLNLMFRLGRFEMTQKIVRHFRGLGFPVCRDFIGRIEVWIPKEEDKSILYNRYTHVPRKLYTMLTLMIMALMSLLEQKCFAGLKSSNITSRGLAAVVLS